MEKEAEFLYKEGVKPPWYLSFRDIEMIKLGWEAHIEYISQGEEGSSDEQKTYKLET